MRIVAFVSKIIFIFLTLIISCETIGPVAIPIFMLSVLLIGISAKRGTK